ARGRAASSSRCTWSARRHSSPRRRGRAPRAGPGRSSHRTPRPRAGRAEPPAPGLATQSATRAAPTPARASAQPDSSQTRSSADSGHAPSTPRSGAPASLGARSREVKRTGDDLRHGVAPSSPMSLAKKLNLKGGTKLRVLGKPKDVDLGDVEVTSLANVK